MTDPQDSSGIRQQLLSGRYVAVGQWADRASFTVKSGIDVYFCNPRSPWQRGGNENANGLLCPVLPKGTDLSGYMQAEIDTVADELNDRPRQTLSLPEPRL